MKPLTESEFYIMAAFTEPRHGYAVMSLVEELTGGEYVIGPASLYTIIRKLQEEELIVLHDNTDSRRKVYLLTEKGRGVLNKEVSRRKVMIELAETGLKRGLE